MTWTRLAHDPRDPPVPKFKPGEKPAQPVAVQAMSTLGSFAKGVAFFLGKQPEDEQRGRGFLGLEWAERHDAGRTEVEISRVLSQSPAEAGGLKPGDRILKINRRAIEGVKGALRGALRRTTRRHTCHQSAAWLGRGPRGTRSDRHRRGGTLRMDTRSTTGSTLVLINGRFRRNQEPKWRTCVSTLLASWSCLGVSTIGLALDPQTAGPVTAAKPAQSTPAEKTNKPATKAVVPFEMLPSNHMLVDAKINDKGPFRLIFDLGAPVTLLNNRASEASGVVKPDAPRSFLFGMRGEAEVDRLKVGELTAEKLPVIVLDHPVLTALEEATGRRIDGIMGFTFFARFKTTIDYQAREMTFEPIDYQVRNLLKDLPDRLMGPKVAQRRVLAPSGLWGLQLGEPVDGPDTQGVAIQKILGGSPAGNAGLTAGDVLSTIDGRWITSVADVYHAAAKVTPGQEVTVVIRRGGKELTLTIKPADGI